MTTDVLAVPGDAPADGLPTPDPASTEGDARPKRRPGRPRGSKTTAPAGAAGTGPADKRPRVATRGRRASKKEVTDSATGLHQLAGALFLPKAGLPATGAKVLEKAEDAGELWGELAERYPLIGRLFSSGGDGVLFMKLAMLYFPIFQHAMAEKSATTVKPDPEVFHADALNGASE